MKSLLKQKTVVFGIFFLLSMGMTGCEGGNLPFKYFFTSSGEVEITYLGATYLINKNIKQPHIPFEYVFEADGDVDITLKGVKYVIDNPYGRSKSGSLESRDEKKSHNS